MPNGSTERLSTGPELPNVVEEEEKPSQFVLEAFAKFGLGKVLEPRQGDDDEIEEDYTIEIGADNKAHKISKLHKKIFENVLANILPDYEFITGRNISYPQDYFN